jgi:hypothetical protein
MLIRSALSGAWRLRRDWDVKIVFPHENNLLKGSKQMRTMDTAFSYRTNTNLLSLTHSALRMTRTVQRIQQMDINIQLYTSNLAGVTHMHIYGNADGVSNIGLYTVLDVQCKYIIYNAIIEQINKRWKQVGERKNRLILSNKFIDRYEYLNSYIV